MSSTFPMGRFCDVRYYVCILSTYACSTGFTTSKINITCGFYKLFAIYYITSFTKLLPCFKVMFFLFS